MADDRYRAEDTGEGAWTVFANEEQRTPAGARHHGGRVVEVFIGTTAQEVAEATCRILNEEFERQAAHDDGVAVAEAFGSPGYRIVTFYEGNTFGWAVPADRIVAGLASRIGKLTGGAGDEGEAVEAAKRLLRAVDAGFPGEPIEIGGEAYDVKMHYGEAQFELAEGTLWLTALDPDETLAAIGVTSVEGRS
jgi:hypothetical protein